MFNLIDIKFIRENPSRVQEAAKNKGIDINVSYLLELDEKRREYIKKIEVIRNERNVKSKSIPVLDAEEKQNTITEVRMLNEELKKYEEELSKIAQEYDELMYVVPSVPVEGVPIGESDEENVEIKRNGEIPIFDFEFKDHVTLGELHDMFDFKRGAKVAGSRMYYLKNDGLNLQRAVLQMALDFLSQKQFTPVSVPVLVREQAMLGTGYFPLGKEQTYSIPKDDLFLVGTSEVPLVSYYSSEILDTQELPIKMAGISDCFRREVGAAGKDTRGLYRVHQFSKIEQVVICKNSAEESQKIHQELLRNSEEILEMLEIPYRVVEVCTGDMGQGQVKKHDIEAWMPSRNNFGETHSCSSFYDFQARRSSLRYRNKDNEINYCYTLNNTAVASPRILIPLLENHQQKDGSIRIPKALRPYMGNREFLQLKK
ncbi:serine--tRNA ligase [Bacillus nitratireducens]|uniref:serine--tRNA ligase n=1 Tax=Bacillus nitratireducens TaxID=2026193 RepID=UPI0028CB8468|nr:serine--tRNA ligase [Bacillus nitratireducens]